MHYKEKYTLCFVLLISTLSLIFTFVRNFLGADITDESYYLALPYHFAKGAKLFVDEEGVQQISGLILTPLVRIFLEMTNSTQYLFLFFRFLYFLIKALICFYTYKIISKEIDYLYAILLTILIFVFIPYSLPSPSYNNLGMLFFFLSIVQNFALYLKIPEVNEANKKAFMLSLTNYIALIAYPTLLLPIFTNYFCNYIYFNSKIKAHIEVRRVISKSFFILISIVVITLFYINPVLFKNTILNQINSKTGQGGGFEKYLVIYNQLKINLLNKLSFFSMLFLILISYFEKKKSLNLTLAKNLFFLIIIPIIYIYSFVGGNFSPSHYFVNFLTIYITLFSLNYLTFTKNNYFLVIYLSFVIAFLTICWSSGNGYIASTIVLLPLLFFILLNYSLYIKSNLEKFGFLILVGMIIICLTKYQFFIYGDDSINELNIMVNKGPYKGIFTSKTKSNYLDALESSFDFCKKKFNPKTLFVYDELPAGYLISNLSPLTKSSWVLSAADGNLNRLRFVNYFREKKEYPDSILKILIMPIQIVNQKHLNYKAEDSIEKFINLNYTICKKNEHFQILIYNQIY